MTTKGSFIYLALVLLISLLATVVVLFADISKDQVTEKISYFHSSMVAFHSRIDQNVPKGAVLFIGDSHVQGLAVQSVHAKAYNYGIGHDTTEGVLQRISRYKSIGSSKAVVLAVGFNDLAYRSNREIIDNIQGIVSLLPRDLNVIVCGLIPVREHTDRRNQRIHEINAALNTAIEGEPNKFYLNAFRGHLTTDKTLPGELYLGDGVHLSKKGYDVWIRELSIMLGKVG